MASIQTERQPSGLGTFVLGILFLAVFSIITVAWIKSTAPDENMIEEERANARIKKREELEKDWASKLQTVAWVDKSKGVVQIPIDDAIKVIATELKEKKVAKTDVKVPPSLPPVVIDPKSAEPPPLPLPSAPQGADVMQFESTASVQSPVPAAPPAQTTPPAAAPIPAAPPAPVPVSPPASASPPLPPPPPIPPASAAQAAASAPRPPLINWTESK
jgi:hypothetical protein